MPHINSFYDREYVYAYDLNGKDVVVEIARVEKRELTAPGNRKNKKPVLYFAGMVKGFALNATNKKTIIAMYGVYTEEWIGKLITLYPTTTEMAGEVVEAIRIRPQVPSGRRKKPDKPEATDTTALEDVVIDPAPEGSVQ